MIIQPHGSICSCSVHRHYLWRAQEPPVHVIALANMAKQRLKAMRTCALSSNRQLAVDVKYIHTFACRYQVRRSLCG